MEFTGERLIPDKTEKELFVEHYQRYIFAKQFVKDKKVVDAACGEGYGSYILSETAESVVGMDIDKETVENAKIKYNRKNLKFISNDICDMDIENNSIDIVVSFETIEHVNEDLQERFLEEVKRILKSDGVLIMSTPNKKIYTDIFEQANKFHMKEFYENEYIVFLEKHFKTNVIKKQFQEIVSSIESSNCYESTESIINQEPKYMISISSDEYIEDNFRGIMNSIEENKYIEITKRIIKLQKEVEERNIHINKLDLEIANISKNTQDSSEKIEILKMKLETEKKERNLEKIKLEAEKANLETEKLILHESIENIRVNMSNKLGHIELLLQSERDLKNSEIYLKNELSKERKNRIDFENELERIKGSRSWKLMTYIWKIAPQGSKRRLVAKITLKFIKMPLVGLSKLNKKNIKKFFYYLKKEGVEGVSKRLDSSFITIENEKLKIEIQKLQSNKDIEEYVRFSVPTFQIPKVSIIIPVYNQFEYTYNCIKSIVENSKNATYEIIVANDLSADLTTRIGEVISGIKVITNKENLRFLKNCNNAAKDVKGEYILFLNNDTQVQENWLIPLIDLIESKKDIGMVGSKLVYPDGRLQEAGGIIWVDGSAWNYGHGQEPEKPEFNYVKEVDYISGASIMIKKELWDEIGGFDERFAPAYYEDSDLAFEVRKYGYKVMFQPKSVVVHFEGASNGTDTNSGQKSYQVANQKKFFEKWKEVLEKEHFENGENVFWARDRSKNKKTILVIDHYIPNYDKDAGGKNTYLYIKLYLKMGLKVVFLGDNFFRQQPYADELEQLGVEILYGSYYQKNWKQWIIENGKYIKYAYLIRPHIAIKYIDILRENTDSRIIYFGSDLHYLRELRQYEIEGDKALLESSKAWKIKEFNLFNKADVIYVVGSYEQQHLMREIKEKTVRNIPVFYYDKIEREQKYEFANRRNLLFVGGFGHKPNEDAVLWFAKEIFPTIEQEIKDIKWYIVGSNPTEEVKALAKNNIIVTGFISDEELNELYRSCKLAIAPLRYGAGVKGKVVEAVYNGIPLVTTPIGAEGLDTNIGAFLVLEPDKDMGKAIITLYYDEEALVKIVSRSREFINEHFTEKIAEKIILLDVEV